jgi:competence/damage-inducible protein CinA-like protein
MVAEIIAVGTELLLGQIVDTNSAYLGKTLASLGIDLFRRVTVGDNEARLVQAMREAAERADLIITCGGLGPTQDDLTKEAVARAFDEELVLDPAAADLLRDFFARRGVPMPENNLRQAMVFRSGRSLPNPMGTAPGALLEKDGKLVICLPGPPRELIPMVDTTIVPLLTERLGGARQVLRSRVLRTIGIGESAMEERVQDLLASTNPTIGTLAHVGESHLRLTAKAASEEEALALIEPLEREIRSRLGAHVYGVDETTLEQAVVELLRTRGRTVAVAESCTGGLLGGRITNVAGSSDVFPGGVISYGNRAKEELLGVPGDLLAAHGAVSAPVAEVMARGARERLHADIGVGVTGVAGPGGGTPEKPVGLVYIALATAEGARSQRYELPGTRADIRARAVLLALDRVRRALLDA